MVKSTPASLRHWTAELLWNYAGLIIMAVSGALVNLIIMVDYDAKFLGLFNIGFAFYIILGQLGTGGIQHGLLHYIAKHEADPVLVKSFITHGFYLILMYGCILSLLWSFASTPIAHLIHKSELILAFKMLTPALFLFVINKVLLMICNGLRQMRAVALGQTSRYMCIMLVVAAVGWVKVPLQVMFICFILAEMVTAFILVMALRDKLFQFSAMDLRQIKKIAQFGVKALPIGALIELNTRVDVLLLSYFVSAESVGLYSFAAMIAEGLMLLLIVVRNQVNPYIAVFIAHQNWSILTELIAMLRKYLYFGALVCFIVINLVYPYVIEWILPGRGLLDTVPILLILSIAFLLAAGFMPFDQILNMGGAPGYQSIQSMIIVGSNIVLNLLLIPSLGIYGAAIATAMANSIIAIATLKYFVQASFSFKI